MLFKVVKGTAKFTWKLMNEMADNQIANLTGDEAIEFWLNRKKFVLVGTDEDEYGYEINTFGGKFDTYEEAKRHRKFGQEIR